MGSYLGKSASSTSNDGYCWGRRRKIRLLNKRYVLSNRKLEDGLLVLACCERVFANIAAVNDMLDDLKLSC